MNLRKILTVKIFLGALTTTKIKYASNVGWDLGLSEIHDNIQVHKTLVIFHLSINQKVQEKNAVAV